jgi:hypothetical protein
MKTDIITRMEAMQQRFGRLQLEDQKFPSLLQSAENERRTQLNIGEYFDREMANRSDNGTLDYLSDEQGDKELGDGWRQ